MFNYLQHKNEIKELKNQIEILHAENKESIQQLKQLRLTAEQEIERVNEAGRRLYPEKYSTRVIENYQHAEARTADRNENANNLI